MGKLLIASLIWGIAAVVIKFTLGGIAPLPFLAYRFTLSFIISVFILFITRPRVPTNPIIWLGIFISGLFSTTLALGFLFLGLDKTTVLNLSLINLAGPLLVAAGGVIFLKETITKREKIGAAIAVAGTAFTIIEPIVLNGSSFGTFEGNVFIMLAMLFDISSIIILKKLLQKRVSPEVLTHSSFVIGFITLLPIVIFSGLGETVDTVIKLPLIYHAGVWYMAVFSGVIAYLLRAQAQKKIKVEQSSLFGYLVPVFSTPLAVLFLGEVLTPLFVAGAVIVSIGVFVAETKRSRT